MSEIHKNQRGMASIVVVSVLIVLLALISMGFARLMNRSVTNSLNNQLNASASYAARSGLNDLLGYIKTQANPATVSSNKCGNLLKKPGLANLIDLSGNGNTQITCMLVNPTPSQLTYDALGPNQSQVVKLTSSSTIDNLLVSWQASNGDRNLPSSGNTALSDVPTWSTNHYVPILRVSLYPIPQGGNISGVASRTYFLMPVSGGGGASTIPSGAADGSIQSVNCNATSFGGFTASGYQCNAIFSGLALPISPNSYYYVRLTSIYGQANIGLEGTDVSGTQVSFQNVQSVLDVTATSGGATKRYREAIDTNTTGSNVSTQDGVSPQAALRSASSVCKRYLNITSPSNIAIDGSYCATTQTPISQPPGPLVAVSPATNINYTYATLHGTVNPNNPPGFSIPVTACYYNWGTSASYGNQIPCSPSPNTGNSAVDVSLQATNLPPAATIYWRLCAANSYTASSPTCATGTTFSTPTPPPPIPQVGGVVSLGANATTVAGTVNPNNPAGFSFPVTNCVFNYGTSPSFGNSAPCSPSPGAGSSPVSVTGNLTGLNMQTTYYYELCAQNAYSALICSPTSGTPPSFTTPLSPPQVQLSWGGYSCGGSCGGSAIIDYTILNASSCTITGDQGTIGFIPALNQPNFPYWYGTYGPGSPPVTYTVTCSGPGGTGSGQVTSPGVPAPIPSPYVYISLGPYRQPDCDGSGIHFYCAILQGGTFFNNAGWIYCNVDANGTFEFNISMPDPASGSKFVGWVGPPDGEPIHAVCQSFTYGTSATATNFVP